MPEHPPRRESDEDVERERRQSTDLGYRDTEEERAYENETVAPPDDDDGAADAG